jgi:beta-mannosidase
MTKTALALTEWQFRQADAENWFPAVVPGCVHTDLLHNGLIPDPFYRTNERELQWIDKQNWEYKTTFDVPVAWLDGSGLELVFDGLDTYGDVYLNGQQILSADNMFRTWKTDVRSLVHPAGNELTVRFRSPILEDLPKLKQLGYALPAANDQSELGNLGEQKVSVFARKAPYHYGWDWGPRFVTSGIWREVRLESWSGCRITDLFIRQREVTAEAADLTAMVEIESDGEQDIVWRLRTEEQLWEKPLRVVKGVQTVQLDLRIDQPALWWCNGLGEPALYTFTAELYDTGTNGIVLAARQVRTGLRSIRLVQVPDSYGASFYIELNGVSIFAKGANHIPNDSFLTEVTEERYRHEIVSAVQSNMNMLRVWGGGTYESDVFYDLCDEYGLLVWQDFMFACSMYPGGETFLKSIREEATCNIRRLRNHPSITIWCGNNEIDSAWAHYNDEAGWGWKQLYTPEQRAQIWSDYEAIFHQLLPDALAEHAPEAAYWPSSPLVSLSRDKSQHASSTSAGGDIHYWGVWHRGHPFEHYNVHLGRFMSEYGFQSFPELDSVMRYAVEEDLELESDVMIVHQKHGSGNRIIKGYMDRYLKEPKDFPAFFYMSQVLQAQAMKAAIHAHRRKKPYCMGTLYWQINDCWPVASWASMDYYGCWKALQYEVKRSFQDVMLSVDSSVGGHLDIYLLSDSPEAVNGMLHVEVLGLEGTRRKSWSHPAGAGSQTSGRVFTLPLRQVLEGIDPREVVLALRLEQEGQVRCRTEHYLVSDRELHLPRPVIHLTEEPGSGGTRFTLSADLLAKQVWLKAEADGIFSDNFFDLIPGRPKMVEFLSRPEGSRQFAPAHPGVLTVRSMSDMVNHSSHKEELKTDGTQH